MEAYDTKAMTVAELKITRITPQVGLIDSQVEGLKSLAHEWEPSQEFWTSESCLDTMRSHPGVLSAAAVTIAENRWLGWYLASYQDDQVELLFIFSSKNARGRGLGRLLLNDLIQQAQAKSELTSIFLEVRPSNATAIKLYESVGFVEISRRPQYYSNGEDALVYRLNLTK